MIDRRPNYSTLGTKEFRSWRRRLLLKNKFYRDFFVIYLPCRWCGKGALLTFESKKSLRFKCSFECGYIATIGKDETTETERREINKAKAVIHGTWKRKPKKKK